MREVRQPSNKGLMFRHGHGIDTVKLGIYQTYPKHVGCSYDFENSIQVYMQLFQKQNLAGSARESFMLLALGHGWTNKILCHKFDAAFSRVKKI